MTAVLIAIAATALALAITVSVLAWRATRALRAQMAQMSELATDAHPPPSATPASEASLERDQLVETVRGLSDGVIVVGRDGQVVLRNAAAARFDHARHGDALAEHAITELLASALEGIPAEREFQLYGPPPETLLVRALPLRRGTRIVGAAAFVRDTSELRRVEHVRRDFVANVSHELKTPIGALSLLAETMVASDDPTVMHQLATRVLADAERLGRLVDDLLDLSLIEAAETTEREPVAVARVVAEAVDRVEPAADGRQIPVRVGEIPQDLTVVCDRDRVVSALTNLLDNAVKYSDPGRPVDVEATNEADRLAVTVRDRGIGIPTRDLERIFERFYRVDRARSRDTGGTGLGLSIVRHVAQAHGGEVTAESREGEGSTFRFVIPDRPLRAVGGVAEAS